MCWSICSPEEFFFFFHGFSIRCCLLFHGFSMLPFHCPLDPCSIWVIPERYYTVDFSLRRAKFLSLKLQLEIECVTGESLSERLLGHTHRLFDRCCHTASSATRHVSAGSLLWREQQERIAKKSRGPAKHTMLATLLSTAEAFRSIVHHKEVQRYVENLCSNNQNNQEKQHNCHWPK